MNPREARVEWEKKNKSEIEALQKAIQEYAKLALVEAFGEIKNKYKPSSFYICIKEAPHNSCHTELQGNLRRYGWIANFCKNQAKYDDYEVREDPNWQKSH